MSEAGYSKTPLAKKLGLKDGQSIAFVGLPDGLSHLKTSHEFSSVTEVSNWSSLPQKGLDFIHLFTDSAATVYAAIPALKSSIKPDGMIWVSWPKKASKVKTDVTEDTIRNRALTDVLVDIKVCAVDDIWSALKLVIRNEHRAALKNV